MSSRSKASGYASPQLLPACLAWNNCKAVHACKRIVMWSAWSRTSGHAQEHEQPCSAVILQKQRKWLETNLMEKHCPPILLEYHEWDGASPGHEGSGWWHVAVPGQRGAPRKVQFSSETFTSCHWSPTRSQRGWRPPRLVFTPPIFGRAFSAGKLTKHAA